MPIATTVRSFLDSHGLSYEVLRHPHTSSSSETANAAYIWKDQLAKSVLLEDDRGYVMAVLPASHRVDLKALQCALGRELHLADEAELADVFGDCEIGAVPPLGGAYGVPVVYDDELSRAGCVYFEGGDHEDLIYMGGAEFLRIFEDAPHCAFSQRV